MRNTEIGSSEAARALKVPQHAGWSFTLAGQAVPSQGWQNPNSCTCG